MNIIDTIILLVLAAGFCIGCYRGLVKELVGTVGFLLAAIAAKLAIPYGVPYISGLIADPRLQRIVVWVVVFVLLMLLMSWIASLVSKLLDAINIGWLNRLAGGALAVLKYSLVSYLVVWGLESITSRFDLFDIAQLLAQSKLTPVLHKVFDLCCSLF